MDRQKRYLRTYLVVAIGVSVAAIIAISFLTMDRDTPRAVSRIDVLSFVVVLGLVAGKWLSECLRFSLIIKAIGRHLPFGQTSKAVLGSAFTGAVTPYRSATVPAQIFFFTRYGLSGGEATAVSTTGAALSVLMLTVTMPLVLIMTASRIHLSLGIRALLVMGAAIGLFVFLFAIYSMRDPSRVSRMLERVIPRYLRKKPWFDRMKEHLTKGMGDFSASLHSLLRSKKSTLAWIVLLTAFYWLSEVFVASWILRGLGFPQYFWTALLAQVVVSSILPFTPVPGESGVAEATFAGVFSIFIARDVVALVTVAWRFFMFYLPLALLGTAFIMATNDAGRLGREQEVVERHAVQPAVEKL